MDSGQHLLAAEAGKLATTAPHSLLLGLAGVTAASVAALIVAPGTGSANPRKNAGPSASTVDTSTERSRYLLPRSHDVSGRNRQA